MWWWTQVSCLYEPHCAVSCDEPVCQEPHDGKVDLAEEEEEREDAHDVAIHAMDLDDPQARGMRVLDAPGLVVLPDVVICGE